ncbi:hypothetical protein Cni_G27947 [Canna indica]|uniref:Protein TILLER ANGLE CONTROL 1 n=1 Tax=Canna indica TaxID=4628 RepID=A0AAQ3L2D5_9LILI|nr:hypothetical protein Cni_G27947 [Canna indica]
MHHKPLPGIKHSQVSQSKDVFGGEDEEKHVVIFEVVMEKEALLFHDVLNSILTIGTLGHQDNFASQFYSLQEDELLEKEENIVNEATKQRKEVVPTIAASMPLPIESFKFKLPVEAQGKKLEMVVQDADETEKIEELPMLKEDKEKREIGRITLADLFAADAIITNDHAENTKKGTKSMNGRLKQHASTCDKKKMQKNKKEEKWISTITKANTNTSRNLQKLMTKLSYKKIHPEAESMPILPNMEDVHMKERKKPLMSGGAESTEWE